MNISLHDTADYRTPARPPARQGHFLFHGPGGMIRAEGVTQPLERGRADTLAARLVRGFAGAGPGAILGGALPFRQDEDDCLWLAQGADFRPAAAPPDLPPPEVRELREEPSGRAYAEAVAGALRIMQAETGQPGALRKIVLARSLLVRAAAPIAAGPLLARLAEDPAATAFRVALPDTATGTPRALIGATPELLLEKRGGAILSYPLAGSARRSTDPVADADACAGLARSDKDRREHAMVVEHILDTLAPWCRDLACPEGTGLTSTRSMWHLGTRIRGRLRDTDTPSVVLAAELHPTPAVCGLPRDRAADLIARLEPAPRGFYAGAVGWCDRQGDGAWHVAIRCAEISGAEARLYAGAGIVPGSDPQAERAETASKFAAFLRALGLPGDAALGLGD